MKYDVKRSQPSFAPITLSMTIESQEELDAMRNLAASNGVPSNEAEARIMSDARDAQRRLEEVL